MQFPAGLIDAGEDAGQAALRELKEETGELCPRLCMLCIKCSAVQRICIHGKLDKQADAACQSSVCKAVPLPASSRGNPLSGCGVQATLEHCLMSPQSGLLTLE